MYMYAALSKCFVAVGSISGVVDSKIIKATFYCLYVGMVRLWNFTSLNTGSVVECYFYSVL